MTVRSTSRSPASPQASSQASSATVEPIIAPLIGSSPGQIDTPVRQSAAENGADPLSSPQRAAKIGEPVPIVFGRRVAGSGGVLVSPPATEARFSNNSANAVTASYHMVITEGRMDGIQTRDVFQQSCRVGTFTQAYGRRAGSWGPGNFITSQPGFENSVPDAPIYCGSGTGSYAGMTTGSFTVTIPAGFRQWDRQVHVFARGGMWVPRLLEGDSEGASNNVADLVRWLMRRSSRVPEELIDQAALLEAARFTDANGLWCNICIDEPSSLADWLAQRLKYFLLRPSRRNGRRGLRPLLPFNSDGTIYTGPVPWVATFTEDQILPESINIDYTSRADRQPICAQMIWRQQPEDGIGLARTADVRYERTALDGPFEQHDLSAFATTENHAFKVGAFIIARRQYIDHRLTIALRPEINIAALSLGDIVRVTLQRVASVGDDTVHDYLYEVDRVGRSVTGQVLVELTHFPVDSEGRSLVALDVAAAAGNGLLLPTGRAAVSCDLNSPTDSSVPVDDGPWGGWDILIDDPAIEGPWDGWDTLIDEVPGDEGDLGDDSPVQQEEDGGYTATVSLSTPIVSYPDVWYAILDPAFASVEVAVSVDNPPIDGSLALTIYDGGPNTYDPENGQFGSGNIYTVVIPEGETSATLTVNAQGDTPFADTPREFVIVGWSGGGYEPVIELVGQSYQETTPALDISATAAFTIAAYVGSLSLQTPGIWFYDTDNSRWQWGGSAGDEWTWDEPTQLWGWGGTSEDWSWDEAEQRWDYVGDAVANWEWLTANQRWRRLTTEDLAGAIPGLPPGVIPSPPPSSLPPVGSTWTVVAQATVDQPPIPNSSNDLAINLVDFTDTDSTDIGVPLIIPAVSMLFGSWRWNPAASRWEYPSPPPGWRWLAADSTWQYLLDSGEWSWDQATGTWVWGGEAGEETTAPGLPPAQNGSYDPPDGARWVYTGSSWGGTAHVSGGAAPDFTGLLSGTLTYHMPANPPANP